MCYAVDNHGFTSFHGAAGNKNHRDVEPHSGVEHAGGNFIAVGDAYEGVGGMGVDHVLHGVGNNFAAR